MNSEVSRHNASVLANLEGGDMVEFPRGLFSHWGVYVGNGHVIHLALDTDGISGSSRNSNSMFSSCGKKSSKGYVSEDEFHAVAAGRKAKKNNGKDAKHNPLSPREIIQRARKMLGKIDYNVLWSNCEHFAAFCRYDVEWSEQVNTAVTVVTIGAAVAAVWGLARAFSTKRD